MSVRPAGHGIRKAALAAWAAVLTGCGYVGDPLPPLLNIPAPVTGLAAIQRGDRILVSFTAPALTTEGTAIKRPVRFELRAGPGAEGAFSAGVWAAGAPVYPVAEAADGALRAKIPAQPWVGREIFLAVQAIGDNGRTAGWSSFVALTVVPPLAVPAGLAVQNVAAGVEIRWQGAAPQYRIFRQDEGAEEPSALAVAEGDRYVDSAVTPGQRYGYQVQAIQRVGDREAESERSATVDILVKDVAPPAAPTGVRAVAGLDAIELAWEPAPEPDAAGYRVYRAAGGGDWVRVAEVDVPAFSDRSAEKAKPYRYSVTAVDRTGNEGTRSETVEIVAP